MTQWNRSKLHLLSRDVARAVKCVALCSGIVTADVVITDFNAAPLGSYNPREGWMAFGNGTSAGHMIYGVGSLPPSVTDLDGDGDLDLATANYFGGNVSVLLNRRIQK